MTADEGSTTRELTFFSNGYRLAAVVHLPPQLRPGEQTPAIVVAGGFGGVKELRLPAICDGLAAAGFICLRFDNQGFGESEGPRWRLIPYEQAQNVRDALTALAAMPEVAADRLGVYGNGWGGSPSIWAASLDERIRCLVLVAAPGNGRRWLRSLRSSEEWDAFLGRLRQDWDARVQTGESEAVASDEIMVPDRRTDSEHRKSDATLVWRPRLPLESAQAVVDYDASTLLPKISGRPILFLHCERDALIDPTESQLNYALVADPRRLVVLEGAEHHDIYYSPWRERAMEASVAWFREHLA